MEEFNAIAPVPAEETAAEALLKEIRDSLELQNKQSRKQIRLLRICLIAVSLVALVAVLCAASVLPMVTQTLTDIDAVVTAIDMEQVDTLLKSGEDAVTAMNDALTHINALDFDALNTTIGNLETTVAGLADIDIDMLNSAIKNLNSTVQPLASFIEKFRK